MGTDTVAYASGNECALLFVRQAVDVFGRGVIMVRRQWFDMRAWWRIQAQQFLERVYQKV